MKSPTRPARKALVAAVVLSLAGAASAQSPAPAVPAASPWPESRLKPDGSWEYTHEQRRNFDLDDSRARHRRTDEHELKLGLGSALSPTLAWYLQVVGLAEDRRTQGSGRDRSSVFGRGEAWVQWRPTAASSGVLQAGRLAWEEKRAWWWDEDLDGLRWQHQLGAFSAQVGLAKEWGRASTEWSGIDPAQRGVVRGFGQLGWTYAPRQALELFWFIANDRSGGQDGVLATEDDTDPSDFRGHWLGLRASGEWRGEGGSRLSYWADAASVQGHDTQTTFQEDDEGRFSADGSRRVSVRGQAFDLGAVWSGGSEARPSLTLAYARGSGGRADDARDENFRQTGLQENRQRLGGLKRVRRYGELLRPELSNLEVITLGAGARLTPVSSLELLGHAYRQVQPSTVLRGARLSADPVGTQTALGHEIDLVYAWRPGEHVELVLSAARFVPGEAFDAQARDPAHGFSLGLSLSF